MGDTGILFEYERAFAIAENMLLAAQDGNWDALMNLRQDYEELMKKIRAQDSNPPDDLVFARRKRELIESILGREQRIGELVSAKMNDLRGAIDSTSQAIKLNQAYRP